MAYKRLSKRAERKEAAKAMARIKAKTIFQEAARFELSFERMKDHREKIIDLTDDFPEEVLKVATETINQTAYGLTPKIQAYVLASEALIEAKGKVDEKEKGDTFKSLLEIIEDPTRVNRQNLIAINPDYLETILKGINSLKLKPTDRRFLRVMSYGYKERRSTIVHRLNSLVSNEIYSPRKFRRLRKNAEKLARNLE